MNIFFLDLSIVNLNSFCFQKFSLENEDIELFQHLNREEDVPCSICCERSFEKSNQIVFCDGCNVAVHQICYGIPNIPEGAWLCKKCANKTKSVVRNKKNSI